MIAGLFPTRPYSKLHFEKMINGKSAVVGRMDETYIKVNGVWRYLYRAVDKEGDTIDFMLSKNRDGSAAKTVFDNRFMH